MDCETLATWHMEILLRGGIEKKMTPTFDNKLQWSFALRDPAGRTFDRKLFRNHFEKKDNGLCDTMKGGSRRTEKSCKARMMMKDGQLGWAGAGAG